MKNVFLSASVPDGQRDARYGATADVAAIKAAVEALADVVAERGWRLVWGGHPTVAPMLAEAMARHGLTMSERVTVYLSREFEAVMPQEDMGERVLTERRESREASLRLMRERMIGENRFEAAVFISGMEGVEQEYALLRGLQPEVQCLPVASTGGAARRIYEAGVFDERLMKERDYAKLFASLMA